MTRLSVKFFLALIIIGFLVPGCASDEKKAQNFLNEAQGYFEKGDYAKAKIQIQNAVKLVPNSVEAHDLLSKVYLKLGDAPETFKTFLRLEQLAPENSEYKLQTASFYLLSKERQEAERRVDEVLNKEPENIKALYLHAGILGAKNEDLNSIKAVYEKILDIDKNQAKAHLVMSKIAMARNTPGEAEDNLKQALAIDPEDTGIYRALFEFYLSRKDLVSAEKVLENLIQKKSDEVEPLLISANFYASQGKTDEAEKRLLKAVEIDPKNLNSYMLLAKLLNSQKKTKEAETYIQKALEIEPDNFEVKNAYADFHLSNNEPAKAEALADEILAKRPDYQPTKLLKGKILAARKDYDKAIDIFQGLVKDDPESPLFNFLLGSAYFEKNDFDKAKPVLSKALEKNPELFQARLMMADMYYRGGDLYLAEDNVKQVLKQMPKHYNANILMGNIVMANQKNDLAKAIFEDMTELEPDNPSAWYRLGMVHQSEKNFPDALKNYNKALSLNPNLMDVFTNLISVYASQKEFKKAAGLCDDQLKKVGENPVVVSIILNLKGNLLLASKEVDQGKALFKQSIEKNPAFITPYLTLANLYTGEGKMDEAIELYKALIEKRPDQASPQSIIGTLYEKQKKSDLAEEHYKKALEIDPDYIPALNNLAFFYAEQGKDLDKALDLARRAKERMGKLPAIMDTLGWVYYKKELYDAALTEFEACVEKEPANPIFNYHLGLAYNKKGDYAKAEKALKKALELQKDFEGSEDARKVLGQI
jgi:tetratricopeptide (TPR) repeat protein